MLSESNRTLVALVEELIPCPFYAVLVDLDDLQQLPERSGVITVIVGQRHFRFHPEFCFACVFLNMNMNGLGRRAFIRIEEKPEATFAEDLWHGSTVSITRETGWDGSNALSDTLNLASHGLFPCLFRVRFEL